MKRRPRTLIVSYHFPPELTPGSFRASGVSAGLADLGWDVTVVTAVSRPEARDHVRVVAVPSPQPLVQRVRLPSALARRLRILWNDHAIPDRHVGWGRPLVAELERLFAMEPFDAVLSTSPPHSTHVAISRLKRKLGFAWVADFRDPWTAPARYARGWLSGKVQRRIEADVLADADAVLANTQGNRDALLASFPGLDADKVHVVPNAFDDAMRRPEPQPPRESADLTYAGEIYKGMTHVLAEALAIVRQRRPDLLPGIALYGSVDPRESQVLERHGLGDIISLRGVVPYEQSLVAMREARALLLLLPRGATWESCVPSKLYPYLAAGRPILAVVPEGDAARVLRTTGGGMALTSDDPEVNASGIIEFITTVRGGTPAHARDEGAIGEYAMSRVVARIDEILRKLPHFSHAE